MYTEQFITERSYLKGVSPAPAAVAILAIAYFEINAVFAI